MPKYSKARSAFGLFYASFVVSALGDAFRLLAVNVWIFTATGGSPGARLLVVLLANIPGMVLGGLSGVIADRYDKYSILVGSDLVRTCVGLGLVWCAFYARPGYALVLVAVGNAVGVFFSSSSFSLLPRLVPESRLPRANGLMETGQWVVQIVGSSLAAVTLALGGAGVAFLVDSASFLLSALVLWTLRRALMTAPTVPNAALSPDLDNEAGSVDGKRPRSSHWTDFIDGLRIIWRGREIRVLLLSSYGVAFLTACTNYGLIFLVARTLSLGAASLGYIYSLNGAVAVLAAAVVTALMKPAFLGRVLAASILGLAISQVIMGLAPDIWVLGVGVAVSAVANAPYNVSVSSLYMSRIPADYLGRVSGIDTMLDNLVTIVGFGAAALTLLLWGPRAIFLLSALVAIPSVILAFTHVAKFDRSAGISEGEIALTS